MSGHASFALQERSGANQCPVGANASSQSPSPRALETVAVVAVIEKE